MQLFTNHQSAITKRKAPQTFLRCSFFVYLLLAAVTAWAQGSPALDQLRADPKKAYGNDYPYSYKTTTLTKAPRGYKPFYISHYARHGSRYYWTDQLYKDLDATLTAAHNRHQLTALGENFYRQFMGVKQELMTGVSELTQMGWEQHQFIARTMYNNFPEVFKRGGNVLAISSLTGRCVISMSAFCQELVQCNPKIEVREQSSRFTLDGVVPTDRQNPIHHNFPRVKPRYEQNRDRFKSDDTLPLTVASRVFTSTDSLPSRPMSHQPLAMALGNDLINLYCTLPSIGHEGMMDGIVSDEEMVRRWEQSNLGSYSWVFGPQYQMIPILQDIINKADAAINGTSDHICDLRFGHDTCLGPLTVLMGINGADKDPEDPFEVKNCYQNWQTCKASNIQLIFYRGKKATDDVLLKCLLNGAEATLPLPADQFPYYKWSDFKRFYTERIAAHTPAEQ